MLLTFLRGTGQHRVIRLKMSLELRLRKPDLNQVEAFRQKPIGACKSNFAEISALGDVDPPAKPDQVPAWVPVSDSKVSAPQESSLLTSGSYHLPVASPAPLNLLMLWHN